MLNLFAGYDAREAIGWHVFCSSVIQHASRPVSICPLDSKGLPHGSNSFTLSRFLVPWLMDYKGHAIFADGSDMLMMADIVELAELFDPAFAVQVVRRPDYTSRHPRKYVGTPMECEQTNYHRKNWASLAIINCGHPSWGWITPRSISECKPLDLLQLKFCGDSIGYLPAAWNVLADEGDDIEDAKLLHYSNGIPAFDHYRNSPGAHHWFNQLQVAFDG